MKLTAKLLKLKDNLQIKDGVELPKPKVTPKKTDLNSAPVTETKDTSVQLTDTI